MNSDDVDRVEQAIIEAIREVGVEQHGTDLTLPTRAMAEAAVEVMAEQVRSIKEARMALIEKADAVVGAYAERWVRVSGLSAAELDSLRDLNDLLNDFVPERMTDEQRAGRDAYLRWKQGEQS